MTRKGSLGTALAMAAVSLCLQPASAQTVRILGPGGVQPNGFSARPSVSANGRFVAFESNATNLIAGDTNERTDIFVYDRETGVTKRVSVATDGTQTDRDSFFPSISGDGRIVAFESLATNLVADDTNKTWDVFVHDTQTGETWRASESTTGQQGDSYSTHASVSEDGRYVTFESNASNLVPNDTDKFSDVFVHDIVARTTACVSLTDGGGEANGPSGYNPTISGDGRYVSFWSNATNLTADSTTGIGDIFVRDTVANTTVLLSKPATGDANDVSAYPVVSGSGDYVAFYSKASNLVPNDTNNTGDIFVVNQQTRAIAHVGAAGDTADWIFGTLQPGISRNGGLVVFSSAEADVVPGKSNGELQAYLYDRPTGVVTLISATASDGPGNGHSYTPSISKDGVWVAFASEASDLVAGDTNNAGDIFIRRLTPPGAFTLPDVGAALRIAGGLSAATPDDVARFGGPVTVATAVHIARKVAGLEPNP